ncbi:CotH kinase family protein [Ilumatobacter sp.]|uniref:CotH kinase family protein n=1 Tax=Ilumatobacter sp. TaxID=1967498 RepID=UPI0037514C12
MLSGTRVWAGVAVAVALLAASCSSSDTPQNIDEATSLVDDATQESIAPPEPGAAVETTDQPEPEVDGEPVALARFESESSDVLFDPGVVHTFAIDLDADKLAELDADPTAEEYVEGSLTFDGETIGPIGVRYKGSVGAFLFCTDGPNAFDPSGAKTCTKLSMKLKMNWEDGGDTFYGVKKVQLHSQNLDTTKMHERLGYWLFREMGVPVPRSTHARVEINGEFVGLFALTEQIDGRFTRENFDDGSGNLYKEVWPFNPDGTARNADEFIDGLQTNEDDDPTAELIVQFAEELADAEPGTEIEVINRWMDVDLLVRTMVVDRAIRNDDGALHWYCFDGCDPHNFYWYENPTNGKLTLLPWDLDNAFDNLGSSGVTGSVTQIADRFGDITDDCAIFVFGRLNLPQKSAACDPLIGPISQLTDEFDAARAEFVAGPFSKESVDERIAQWSTQIEDLVAEAEATHADGQPVAAWREAMAAMISDIDAARETDGR